MTFRDYLRVARERRVLVVLLTLVFGGVGLYYSLRQQPVYTASAALEFQSINVDSSTLGPRVDEGGQTPEQRAAVNASILVREEVLERAAKILKAPVPASAVDARPEARTHLVVVRGQAGTADGVAALTNAVAQAAAEVSRDETRAGFKDRADALRSVYKELREQAKEAQGLLAFRILQVRDSITRLDELARVATPVIMRRKASAPTSPISPKPIRTTLLGLLVGLTIGLVAAFVRDSLDRRFKSSREISEEMHLPLLGFVPENALGQRLVDAKGKSMSPEHLEGFRVLRTNIEFLDVDKPPQVVLVTSAMPEEGKSTITSGLATAYALAGKRTLLVETDLRRPTLSARLGVNLNPGLSDYLAGRAAPHEILQTVAPPGAPANGSGPVDSGAVPFVVIAAGSPAPQPAELLRSNRCKTFFEQVREVYDVVIIDSSPLLAVVDTLELLPIVDAVVLCVRASKTTREQARAAKSALSHFPDHPTGVVVTGIRSREDAVDYGYYSYGYVYGAGSR